MTEKQQAALTDPRLWKGEAKAIQAVLAAGDQFGYGNLIAHLSTAWAGTLITAYGMSPSSAIAMATAPRILRECVELAHGEKRVCPTCGHEEAAQ